MPALLQHPGQAQCPQSDSAVVSPGIAVVQLELDERLRLDASADNSVCVVDGVLYVRLEDDDTILTAGDALVIGAGERYHAWNAGDEPARVIVGDRTLAMHA